MIIVDAATDRVAVTILGGDGDGAEGAGDILVCTAGWW